jgi:hypothetical protein
MRDKLPLRIDLDVSRRQRGAIVASFATTAVLLLALPLPAGVGPCGVLLIVALAIRARRCLPPAALIIRLDASLVLLWRNGTVTEAVLCNGGYLGPALTTIVFKEHGRRRAQSLLITGDMLTADAFRRLRVHLRYARSGDDQAEPDSHAWASTSAALSPLDCPPIR